MVKMSDVAKLANVSTATVSRVLRSPETVKENTRQKVLSVIEELNYQPNILARHFRRSETNTILVIVPNIMNTVFAEIVGGIEQAAAANGYKVLLRNTNLDVRNEYEAIDHLKQRQVDGMILLSERLEKKTLLEISKQYPVVLASAYIEGLKVPTVSIDNISSSREATEHLIRLGHKRIANICGPLFSSISRDRLKGFKQAVYQNDLEVDSVLIQEGEFTFDSGYNQMLKFLALEVPPTAVFAANDEMAMGAIKAAKENGLKVPEDMAVVGFDNIKFSSMFEPALTTIAQPKYEMGKKAMELLLEQMQGVVHTKIQHVLDTNLVIRDSCGAKKAELV
ncbi:LacI family DNA-binding transcriptional regulator [Pseudalkalibacillus caeni]|uniref:LacI family transcriptional regulator n=1 Tax=Exobacillus caeni TaxID=2574798 RepID=A0A5R9FAK2_9BACL|nr:LacI family DNA-binding transcriptional regulator [Pseudalkalibacillus caeni]TLS38688.1 LacI family transcriptional regulator [Pseudalkalibacillus caeni]